MYLLYFPPYIFVSAVASLSATSSLVQVRFILWVQSSIDTVRIVNIHLNIGTQKIPGRPELACGFQTDGSSYYSLQLKDSVMKSMLVQLMSLKSVVRFQAITDQSKLWNETEFSEPVVKRLDHDNTTVLWLRPTSVQDCRMNESMRTNKRWTNCRASVRYVKYMDGQGRVESSPKVTILRPYHGWWSNVG